MGLRFFFQFPETTGTDSDMLDVGPLGDIAVAAQRAGFYGIALTEHPVPGARWLSSGGHQSLDPLVALGYVAGATTRLRLLTNLVVAPYRNPFLLAKAAATVDKLSGGRLILGLGAGYQKSEFFALGIDFEERNALFDEALEALPLHWRGEPFSFEGRHFSARDVIARPRPVQDPIPIWIGGNSRLSRRRVASKAQGWMPMMGGPQLVKTARTTSIESLAQLGGMITEVKNAALEAGRTDSLDFLSSYQDATIEAPATEADRHRERLAEIEKAGVTSLVISAPTRQAAPTMDFIEAFGQAYLSLLGHPRARAISGRIASMNLQDATLVFRTESAQHPAVASIAQSVYDHLLDGEVVDYRLLDNLLGEASGKGVLRAMRQKYGAVAFEAILSPIMDVIAHTKPIGSTRPEWHPAPDDDPLAVRY